ncbi:DUF6438 domain-containing protein [Mucilaginibacter sp. Mucisp86]|uniref:DUF6438 domain-containing protein n=1 Tax=Mucilaginibacter sp. Mucisp86 TaxID=3243060 RepID=UPI0039B683DA
MKFLLPIFLLLLFSSCKNTLQNNQKDILGDWIRIRNSDVEKTGMSSLIAPPNKTGFSFYADQTFDNKGGFIKHNENTQTYLDTRSRYKLKIDSLILFDPVKGQWEHYHLIKLSADLLQFDSSEGLYTFRRFNPHNFAENKFDKIILSTSGCLGTCPVMDITLNSDRTILFSGKMFTGEMKGQFTGTVPQDKYEQIQKSFRIINFEKIKQDGIFPADIETVTTTYVKNGRIYKTIQSGSDIDLLPLNWACNSLRYIYQTIPLKKAAETNIKATTYIIASASFTKNDSLIYLKNSEVAYLSELLDKGKKVNTSLFKSRFKLYLYSFGQPRDSVDTDGRYFKFIKKGKPFIIDLGFNFYDVNTQNWHWKKATDN